MAFNFNILAVPTLCSAVIKYTVRPVWYICLLLRFLWVVGMQSSVKRVSNIPSVSGYELPYLVSHFPVSRSCKTSLKVETMSDHIRGKKRYVAWLASSGFLHGKSGFKVIVIRSFCV
jgi:hypothetical protein